MKKSDVLWSARFSKPIADSTLQFSSSIDLDKHLYREDITGSIAHVQMLAAKKLLTQKEAQRIRKGLLEIQRELEKGTLKLSWRQEDIHTAVEKRLIQKIGQLGGKLHTARSRNDQVSLDERLYLRKSIDEIHLAIRQLQRALLRASRKYLGTLMPGYTHLQHAQPVLLSHHLLAYISMLQRDDERLRDCRNRLNRSPLGAGALAGTSLPIDRKDVARRLQFDGIAENSLDAVSDRDYVIEFAAASSILAMHLSRLSEELVLWSTREFGFLKIDDAYATGSSMLPQKKNPDVAELVRGKTGRVYGNLMNLLTIMKALPLTYNRDMQEDKFPMLDTTNTVRSCLTILAEMLSHSSFNVEELEGRARSD
ncbi:MAG: argininosuccinate lyase, partial [Bacteroidota bacterium]